MQMRETTAAAAGCNSQNALPLKDPLPHLCDLAGDRYLAYLGTVLYDTTGLMKWTT